MIAAAAAAIVYHGLGSSGDLGRGLIGQLASAGVAACVMYVVSVSMVVVAAGLMTGRSPFQIDYDDYRDTGSGVKIPFVEVHLTNIYAREPERRRSALADAALAVICGFGAYGYELALRGLVKVLPVPAGG